MTFASGSLIDEVAAQPLLNSRNHYSVSDSKNTKTTRSSFYKYRFMTLTA